MKTRLFHSIVVCGAALGALPLACASDPESGAGEPGVRVPEATPDAASDVTAPEERCRAEDGGCVEHCAPLADGGCLDPCFVHTETCSPDCILPDGGCGWPPTK